ncbi:extracellular calcium-sensing receptor-like, partial [Haplochromis burtoni]|uniref:extracellular calcium-sensing receptor-like n=1 Tax=Haplochromis burtoni TaxID=8153 RepID=UPI0003BC5F96
MSSSVFPSSCQLQGQFHLNIMHKSGDVILGGLFPVHFFSSVPDLSFASEPQQPSCHGFYVQGFRQAQTMAFAVDEINNNSNLLPNVTVGYTLYDNCAELRIGFRGALSLASGQEEQIILHNTCVGKPPVLAIVGETSSTRSIAISSVLGLYRVPMLLYYLERVNFSTPFGDQVSFDENGDVVPIYDVMNWLWLPDGSTKVQNVGEVKRSTFKDEEIILDEDKIFWNFQSKKPVRSVCSESCPPGTHMVRKKGEPKCCFDCIPCSEGKVTNKSNSLECTSCPEDFWSNPQSDQCVPKKTEFLSYLEPLGICLTAASLLGTFICTVVLGIFIYHRRTPIVRASNSELSFQLLLSLKLCFLCSLLFIGRPRMWTCQLRHAAFGISFVLCVSCILVKTMVVLAVFKASKPGGGTSLKWFGVTQQRGTVLCLTSIQAVI